MCSLQLCCAIKVEHEDSPVLQRRKAEYEQDQKKNNKLLHRRTDSDLREKGNLWWAVIFSFFYVNSDCGFCLPLPCGWRESLSSARQLQEIHAHSLERDGANLQGDARDEAAHADSRSRISVTWFPFSLFYEIKFKSNRQPKHPKASVRIHRR